MPRSRRTGGRATPPHGGRGPFAQARLREAWEGGLVVAANLLRVGDGAQRAPETRALTPEPTDSCRRARTETGWQEGGA